MRVGWIGLGKLGRPMARHVLAGGHRLLVCDPVPDAVAAPVAAGAEVRPDAAALAREAEIVVSTIPDDRALEAVALGPGGVLAALPPGAVYVDMSTVSPEACGRVRAEAEARGALYVAAPVSGSTATAEAAALTVFASGPADALDRLEPLFARFAKRTFRVGAGSEARFLKLAVNHLVGSTAQIVAESLALARKGGVAWGPLLDALGASVAASPLVAYKLDPLRRRDFTPAFTVAQMIKDMDLAAAAGQKAGVPMPLAEAVLERFREQAAAGLGAEDFFAAVKDVERRSGLAEP